METVSADNSSGKFGQVGKRVCDGKGRIRIKEEDWQMREGDLLHHC